MRLATPLFHHSNLEASVDREKELPKNQAKFPSFFHKIWQGLSTVITSKNDLKVWRKSHADGSNEWHAYDPATGRSTCVASDAEMRVWIEQQYYQ